MLGAVVALALVLLSFKKVHPGASRIEKLVAPAQVRKLLGTPNESARAGGQLCWDYGTPLSKGGMYAVCFRRGKVTYRSHG